MSVIRAKWAVIGNGCIGSATAASLAASLAMPSAAQQGGSSTAATHSEKDATRVVDVCLLGTPETPASHQDQGRILRAIDAEGDVRWVAANAGSMAKIQQLTEESGIAFHVSAGSAIVGCASFISHVNQAMNTAQALLKREVQREHVILDTDALQKLLPAAAVPDGYEGFHDGGEIKFHPFSLDRE